MAALLTVKHNIEVAHRLFLTPGKCENIHGHSMHVELSISGDIGANDLMIPNPDAVWANKEQLEFGELKSWFRSILDVNFDHHLILNADDPLMKLTLPGAVYLEGDPTTENIAKWVYEAAYKQYVQMELRPMTGRSMLSVTVHETDVNSATYGDTPWKLAIK